MIHTKISHDDDLESQSIDSSDQEELNKEIAKCEKEVARIEK